MAQGQYGPGNARLLDGITPPPPSFTPLPLSVSVSFLLVDALENEIPRVSLSDPSVLPAARRRNVTAHMRGVN